MRLPCEIVKDLLPLYQDGVCSEKSKIAVEEHLKSCEECGKLLENVQCFPEISLFEEDSSKEKIVISGVKRIKKWWLLSITLVIILVPICILSCNQVLNRGIHFGNLHELYLGNAYMNHLKESDYESAYKMMNIEPIKEGWIKEHQFDEQTLKTFKEDGLNKFCEASHKLENEGGIAEFHYKAVIAQGEQYELRYKVVIDGKERDITVNVSDEGVLDISSKDGRVEDSVTYLGLWDFWLWTDYEGCEYDIETNSFIYQ